MSEFTIIAEKAIGKIGKPEKFGVWYY